MRADLALLVENASAHADGQRGERRGDGSRVLDDELALAVAVGPQRPGMRTVTVTAFVVRERAWCARGARATAAGWFDAAWMRRSRSRPLERT